MKHTRITLTIVCALAMLLAVSLAFAGSANATPAEAPTGAPASTVTSFARYTLFNLAGITQTANGTAIRIGGFESIDCFGTIDVSLAQTVTVSFQASADGTNYVTVDALPAVTSDSTNVTRTLVYGEYFRPVVTLGSANPVTASVKCVAKN